MLRLSKKVEYAILAMQFIAMQPEKIVSAKEMSLRLNLSFEFLSKTLQILMKNNLITSVQGIHGGYQLTSDPDETTIASIIDAIEGRSSLVECFVITEKLNCERISSCTIRDPMKMIQFKIDNVFRSTTIAELAGKPSLTLS